MHKVTNLWVMKLGTLRTRLARSILGVVICFFVFQNAAFAGFTHGRPTHGSASEHVVAAVGEHCSHDARGDSRPPTHEHGHSQCCIVCGKSVAKSLDPFIVLFTSIALPAPQRAASTAERLLDARDEHPTGWVSSWSSRAPPLS